MMFATCETKRGLDFLKKHLEDDSIKKEDVPNLIELVEMDILRVTDPDFHSELVLIGGKSYDENYKEQIEKARNEVMEMMK